MTPTKGDLTVTNPNREPPPHIKVPGNLSEKFHILADETRRAAAAWKTDAEAVEQSHGRVRDTNPSDRGIGGGGAVGRPTARGRRANAKRFRAAKASRHGAGGKADPVEHAARRLAATVSTGHAA